MIYTVAVIPDLRRTVSLVFHGLTKFLMRSFGSEGEQQLVDFEKKVGWIVCTLWKLLNKITLQALRWNPQR